MAAEKFTQQIGDTINQGFVTTGIALGTRLGMFKALAGLSQSKEAAVTSQQFADRLSFKERYVREWINGMVCGKVVDHVEIDGTDKYWLEPYRLPALLGDDLSWQGVYSEVVVIGCLAMSMVEKCFPLDGPAGTEIESYPEFHQFLQSHPLKWQEAENCQLIIDDVDLQKRLEDGIKVLELGCGGGHPTKAMATCYPKSTFIATDISPPAVEGTKENTKDLSNVSCQILDACNIPDELVGQFDLVMLFDVYHDLPQPQKLVDGACNLLKSGGQFLMNEVNVHERVTDNKNNNGLTAAFHYNISTLYCLPTCVNNPNAEGLGACGGKELYERRLKQDFVKVEKIGKKFGLFFLCTK